MSGKKRVVAAVGITIVVVAGVWIGLQLTGGWGSREKADPPASKFKAWLSTVDTSVVAVKSMPSIRDTSRNALYILLPDAEEAGKVLNHLLVAGERVREEYGASAVNEFVILFSREDLAETAFAFKGEALHPLNEAGKTGGGKAMVALWQNRPDFMVPASDVPRHAREWAASLAGGKGDREKTDPVIVTFKATVAGDTDLSNCRIMAAKSLRDESRRSLYVVPPSTQATTTNATPMFAKVIVGGFKAREKHGGRAVNELVILFPQTGAIFTFRGEMLAQMIDQISQCGKDDTKRILAALTLGSVRPFPTRGDLPDQVREWMQ